jgi:hypothetical protein
MMLSELCSTVFTLKNINSSWAEQVYSHGEFTTCCSLVFSIVYIAFDHRDISFVNINGGNSTDPCNQYCCKIGFVFILGMFFSGHSEKESFFIVLAVP